MLGEAIVKFYLKKKNQPPSIQKSTFKDLAAAVDFLNPALSEQIRRFAYIMNRVGANHVKLEKNFDIEDYKNALVESVKCIVYIYQLVFKPKLKAEENLVIDHGIEKYYEVSFRGTKCFFCIQQKVQESPLIVVMRWKQRKNSFVKVLSLLPGDYYYYFILDGELVVDMDSDYGTFAKF
jgi:hypothetical protein